MNVVLRFILASAVVVSFIAIIACSTALGTNNSSTTASSSSVSKSSSSSSISPSWVTLGSPGFSAGEAYRTSLAFYNGTPYVAYSDGGNNGKATVMVYK